MTRTWGVVILLGQLFLGLGICCYAVLVVVSICLGIDWRIALVLSLLLGYVAIAWAFIQPTRQRVRIAMGVAAALLLIHVAEGIRQLVARGGWDWENQLVPLLETIGAVAMAAGLWDTWSQAKAEPAGRIPSE